MTKKGLARKLILAELIGFAIVIFILWANELFDFPHLFFGAKATPINWVESIFETALIVVLCACTTFFTGRLLERIKYLEGFLPVCSFCKRIRVGDDWIPIEDFISRRSEAVFSHGLCPDCAEKHYPELFKQGGQGDNQVETL
ncbi:MAG: hypothetical protein PVH35_04415 [Syntrophobacterales bacterium]